MKPLAPFILAALTLSVPAALAEENKPSESKHREAHVDIGPIGVSVAVSGHEGGKTEKTAYLGVVTGPVSPQLRAQLDLPEGMGLSVEAVSKDSPAEKAGLRQYDVLKKFNDQMLCAQEQLSVLVKAAGKNTNVSLVVLRGGKEMNVTVTLGEHLAPLNGKARFSINGVPGLSIDVQDLDAFPGGFGGAFSRSFSGEPHKGSAGIQQNWEEMKKKNEQRQKEVEEQIDRAMKKAREAAKKGAEAAEQAGNQAKAQVFSFYPHGQSQSVVTISDTDGSVEVTDANGNRTVKVKDASGKEIHSGSLNTKEDHEAVPENFRAKVKDAESKIKTPGEGELRKKLEKKVEIHKSPDDSI